MTTNLTRTHGAHRAPRYPHDYLHQDRPYAETQSDIGGGLLLGAITVITLMAFIVLGLV
jgi:hypothetical protein